MYCADVPLSNYSLTHSRPDLTGGGTGDVRLQVRPVYLLRHHAKAPTPPGQLATSPGTHRGTGANIAFSPGTFRYSGPILISEVKVQ